MARSAAQVVENNFVKGLVTEATGLNYPENSCIETWDCQFDFFGRVLRRQGFDFEFGYSNVAISKAACAINVYLWKNVTGDGLISFVVTQVGSTLYFYNAIDVAQLSGGLISSTINLATFSPSGATAPNFNDCQFADGLSKLYVFHPFLENFYVTYDPIANTVTATQYELMMRDFEGQLVLDPYAIDFRPPVTISTVDKHHLYNLYNQGWINADGTTPALTSWQNGQSADSAHGIVASGGMGNLPSNCDVWWLFKNGYDVFDHYQAVQTGLMGVSRGNTLAPNGHYLLNVYNLDRGTASGLTGLTNTTSGTARTSTGAFFAGRVFYSGINAAGYTSKIYFTQIIERDDQLGNCYQQCDPTNQDLFDLLPADGGVISIPEAGTIYKLFPSTNGLLVFAYRGVWLITGSVGTGFTATDFTVSKLSSIRTVSSTSFVDVNGVPMWWNTDGIFTCQGGNLQASPQVQSMSISTIQTFFNDIPNASKLTAKGYFNPLEQTVQWLFTTIEPSIIDDQYTFNSVLNYNVLTGAFYPWTIAPGDPSIHALVVVDGLGGTAVESLIVDNTGTQVVDNLGNSVDAYSLTNTSILPKTKFLTSFPISGVNNFTWSENISATYTDWATYGTNENYTSYFITGYKIHGQAEMKFQPMYVYVYHEGLGQAYIQGIWDFATSSDTGRYSSKQLLTYDDPNYSNNHKRVKIRGQGLTLQYYIHSLPGQPFTMIGWSTFESGNQAV